MGVTEIIDTYAHTLMVKFIGGIEGNYTMKTNVSHSTPDGEKGKRNHLGMIWNFLK